MSEDQPQMFAGPTGSVVDVVVPVDPDNNSIGATELVGEPIAATPLAKRDDQQLAAPAISLPPVSIMRPLLDEYVVRRNSFRQWLFEQLQSGVHYGVPPGCEPKRNADGQAIDRKGKVITAEQWVHRPSLYAAGAEFIRDLLQVDDRYDASESMWKMMGEPKGTLIIRCRLHKRKGSPFFPNHTDEDLLAEAFGAEKLSDYSDPNKTIKIGVKRALVAAVIALAAIRDLFTQDPEAMRRGSEADQPQVPTREQRKQQTATEPTMSQRLNTLYNLWRGKTLKAGDERKWPELKDLFNDWARRELRISRDMTSPDSWTLDAINACTDSLA